MMAKLYLDKCSLNFLTYALELRKNLNQKLTQLGIYLGLRDERQCHSFVTVPFFLEISSPYFQLLNTDNTWPTQVIYIYQYHNIFRFGTFTFFSAIHSVVSMNRPIRCKLYLSILHYFRFGIMLYI